MSQHIENLRWGIRFGVTFAVFYCVFGVVIYLTRGPGPFEANEVSLVGVLLAYLGGGIAAGALVGLLRPLLRWRLGALVVGIMATFIVGIGFRSIISGFTPWTQHDLRTNAGFALILGGLTSMMVWRPPSKT